MTLVDEGPVLLATKLHPPVRHGLVPRPRLVTRLRPTDHRLTLVDAPAGWGKTSLLAQWHAEGQGHAEAPGHSGEQAAGAVAWLALDAGDNDPVLFWSYVMAALRTRVPGIGARASAALGAGPAALREAAIPALVNELVGVTEPLVLVLDDYHAITDPAVHSSVALLLERLPAHIHLVVTTRGDPPLPLGRLRVAGELAELRTDDLAFRDDEVATLLAGVPGAVLRDADVARLAQRTEGWPAGLSLAAASLAARPGDTATFVEEFTGTDRFVLDYLGSEVLAGLDDDQREFLLRTSILRRLSPALCEAVTGRAGAATMLDRIERAGVFLVSLDPARQWFRYHRLFGELLRHELALAEPTLVPELHRRAAAWSTAHGAITEAVQHHVAAGATASAAELVVRSWTDWFNAGRLGTVIGWLDLLPPALVRSDPRLCAARAWPLLDLGRLDEVDRWVAIGEAAADAAPDVAARRDLAVLRSVHRFKIGDLAAAGTAALRVLGFGAGEVCFASTVAHLVLGVVAFWNGEHALARRQLVEAVRTARITDNALGECYGLGYLALVAVDDGPLDRDGFDRASRAVAVAVERAADPGVAEHFVAAIPQLARALLLSVAGRPDGAVEASSRALELAGRGAGRLELAYALAVRAHADGAAQDSQRWREDARRLTRSCPDPGRLPARLARLRGPAVTRPRPLPVPAEGTTALSERERELLPLLAGTLSQREIGAVLHLSLNTVKTHSRMLFRKLGVSSRAEAVTRARELGLLEVGRERRP